MKRYRRIDDILVFEWKGDFSIITEINDSLKSFNETSDYEIKVKIDDDGHLIISNCHENGIISLLVDINDYIIFDTTDKLMSLNSYSENELNDKFILI